MKQAKSFLVLVFSRILTFSEILNRPNIFCSLNRNLWISNTGLAQSRRDALLVETDGEALVSWAGIIEMEVAKNKKDGGSGEGAYLKGGVRNASVRPLPSTVVD